MQLMAHAAKEATHFESRLYQQTDPAREYNYRFRFNFVVNIRTPAITLPDVQEFSVEIAINTQHKPWCSLPDAVGSSLLDAVRKEMKSSIVSSERWMLLCSVWKRLREYDYCSMF